VSSFDVAIIGGGIIGGSIAFQLAAEKLKVVILDRQQPGQEASRAAAGMLSPGPDSPEALPLAPLSMESLRLYPEFASEVEEASGLHTAFVRDGALRIFFGPDGESERERMAAEYRPLGLGFESISRDDARKLEKSLSPAAYAAALIPDEAMVDPRLLTDAVMEAARRGGVEIRHDCPVTAVVRSGDRCDGVIAGGERIAAKFVVVAAGAYSGGIDWLAQYAPTRPVRGQMLALRAAHLRLRRVLRYEKGYLVPRGDGRIIAGSTLEEAGFDQHVTPSGIRNIIDAALNLIPELATAQILETWAGLRPGTPDNLPILGPTEIAGLLIATGHYRNGILLAPVTAKLLRQWILTGQAFMDTAAFSPSRYSGEKSHSSAAKAASVIPGFH
jgi:glycine oxidase